MQSSGEKWVRFLRICVILAAATGTAFATIYYHFRLADSSSIAGFFALIVLSLIDYAFDREVALAIYRSFKFVATAFILVAVAGGLYSLFHLNGVVSAHNDPRIRDAVYRHVFNIQASFAALMTALLLSSAYAFWKFKATRFAEGRIGLLKDLFIDVNHTLARTEIPAETRCDEVVKLCLYALLAALELSPWQWLLRKVRLVKRSACTCTALLLKPDHSKQQFLIAASAYPKDTPASVLDVFKTLEACYFPVFLNEPKFLELVEMAKGQHPKGWLNRYFNFKNREKVISAVGWIGAKREILLSHDASKCRAFDSSFINLLEDKKTPSSDISWTRIRSFIGCPLGLPDEAPSRVLFVTKSITHGFVQEDLEIVIAVSELINSALWATRA